MRDVFFTIVAVYVVWKILGEISASKAKRNHNSEPHITNKNQSSRNNNHDDEYVDYEEVK
jgi:hypothetical protein